MEELIGKPVTSLQTMLRVIAAQEETVPPVIPDGIYGEQTKRSVMAVQKKAGLPCTGVTDFATWNEVCAQFEAASVEQFPAQPLEISLSPNQTIGHGSENRHVLLIQAMLKTVAQVYGNLPDCTVCGVCDDETVKAVKALQAACGMQPNGVIDKALWRQLTGLYAQAAGNGEPEILPCASRAPSPHAEPPFTDF